MQEIYRKVLGKQGEFNELSVEYDDCMSDNQRLRKLVSMRNILTENRQQCKVITGKKASFTQEKH